MTTPPLSNNAHYQCVIIGGGIQGCGVAQAMAAAGFSVLLVEKNSLGSGTSSKSSKLIHGGLRYLASGQFGLVRQSLQERARLLKLAPSLVELKKFYLPIYRGARYGALSIRAGLSLYSLLGSFKQDARFEKLPRSQWSSLGGINQNGLQHVFSYYDAQTDDQLLTKAVGHSAKELGATLLENCRFVAARHTQTNATAGKSIYVSLENNSVVNSVNQAIEVSCDLLINASGPWVTDTLKTIDFATPPPALSLIQGTHLEFDAAIGDDIFYVESPDDQRPVFIMPRKHGAQQGMLIGTTEKEHLGAADTCEPSQQEIDYLLRALKHYFPNYQGNMTSSWSGLRVLPSSKENTAGTTRQFSDQSRDTMIDVDSQESPNLISLYGGKLTTYRATAAKVATRATTALAKKGVYPQGAPRDTAEIQLSTPTQ